MPNTTLLTFNVEDRRARAAFSRLKREVDSLEDEFKTTRSTAREAGEAIETLGKRSRVSAENVDRLGDEAQKSGVQIDNLSNAARRTNATWRDTNGRLRDVRGRFMDAGHGVSVFTRSLGGVRGILTGLGAALAAREIFEFGTASVQAAGKMEGLLRGLRAIEGTQADARLGDFETATRNTENFALTLAKLRADAEDTRAALNISINPQQLSTGFQAALAASNAYYNARIANAQNALAQETAGTEAYNTLQTRIFALGRQRLQAQQQISAENQRLLQQLSQERIDAANAASTAEVAGFKAAAQAGQAYTDQLTRQINAIPRVSSPDAQYGNFTSQLRQDFEETERQGHSLLAVMREIANYAFATDLEDRIPDPIVRGAAIDERIAAEAQGAKTINTIRQQAGEQGRTFLNRIRRDEQRDIQRSINANARQYRQFANLVSNTFLDLATGRVESFQQVATAFISQSVRIIARAFIEHQIRLRLDDQLTAARIANIQKVSAAQSAVGAGGLGNLAGLGNLPGLGRLGSTLSGGGAALGVSALLFPEQIKNLAGGISETISGLLSNVASAPDRTFGAQQVFLKIGENETREISDYQDELRENNRL